MKDNYDKFIEFVRKQPRESLFNNSEIIFNKNLEIKEGTSELLTLEYKLFEKVTGHSYILISNKHHITGWEDYIENQEQKIIANPQDFDPIKYFSRLKRKKDRDDNPKLGTLLFAKKLVELEKTYPLLNNSYLTITALKQRGIDFFLEGLKLNWDYLKKGKYTFPEILQTSVDYAKKQDFPFK